MKYAIVVLLMLLVTSGSTFGQTSAQELASNLRLQLSELETKQAALQTRLQELDENMKPESIERSMAGVGSMKPEDLREQKRRQLEIERNGVQKQLDLLAASRARLETSIARADADAYRQSAAPQIALPTTNAETPSGSAVIEPKTAPAIRRQPRKRRVRRARRGHHMQTKVVLPAQAPSPAVSAKSAPVPVN